MNRNLHFEQASSANSHNFPLEDSPHSLCPASRTQPTDTPLPFDFVGSVCNRTVFIFSAYNLFVSPLFYAPSLGFFYSDRLTGSVPSLHPLSTFKKEMLLFLLLPASNERLLKCRSDLEHHDVRRGEANRWKRDSKVRKKFEDVPKTFKDIRKHHSHQVRTSGPSLQVVREKFRTTEPRNCEDARVQFSGVSVHSREREREKTKMATKNGNPKWKPPKFKCEIHH